MLRCKEILVGVISLIMTALVIGAAPVQAAENAKPTPGKTMTLKKHQFPQRGELVKKPKVENGKRYLPMGKKAMASLPSIADDFAYIFSDDGAAIGLRLVGASPTEATSTAEATEVIYKEAWSTADLSVAVTEDHYKDTMILYEPPSTNTWTYEMALDNLAPQWADGTLYFVSMADQQKRFQLGQLIATDAKGDSFPVQPSVRAVDGSWWLDITLSEQWLRTASYPVLVDPSIYTYNEAVVNAFGGNVTTVTQSDSGAVAAIDTTGTGWPYVTFDQGITWTGDGSTVVQQPNRRLVTEGDRNIVVYVEKQGATYSILERHQEGLNPTWSVATTVAQGLGSEPLIEVSTSPSNLMLIYSLGPNEVYAVISRDRGGTWTVTQLPVVGETGSVKTTGLQYFHSKYYAIVTHREGTDPRNQTTCTPTCQTVYIPGTPIRTKASAFVANSPDGPWQVTSLYDHTTLYNEAAGQTYQHAHYISKLNEVNGVLLYFDYHYSPYSCAGWTAGTTYYSGSQRICGRLSENNTPLSEAHELQGDGTWKNFNAVAAFWLQYGYVVPTSSGGVIVHANGYIMSYTPSNRTLDLSYSFSEGPFWRLAEPVRNHVLTGVKRRSSQLLFTTSQGDVTPPTISNLTVDKLYSTGSWRFNVTMSDNTFHGPVEGTDPFGNTFRQGAQPGVGLSGFPDGPYAWQFRALDWNDNRSAPVSMTVYLDKTAPTVALTSPSGNPPVVMPGNLALEALATDNLAMDKVQFFSGSTLLGTVASAPWTFQWDTQSVARGWHNLTAKAFDRAGNMKVSAPLSIVVADSMPTVNLTAPQPNAVLKGPFAVRADASDPNGVTNVEFRVDGAVVGQVAAGPYELVLNAEAMAPGAHTLTVRAYNSQSAFTDASVGVTTARDQTAPSVSLTSPAPGARLFGDLLLEALASDDVAVTKVAFFQNGTLIGTATAAPWSVTWNTAASGEGPYTLTAVVTDHAGNATTSAPVTVVVTDNAPTISWVEPTSGEQLVGPFFAHVQATDPVGIAKVEILVDEIRAGELSASPYQIMLNAEALTPGPHRISAKAYNAEGGVSTSSLDVVTARDTVAPTVSFQALSEGQKLWGSQAIQVNAFDNYGLNRVEFFAGAVNIGTATAEAWSIMWNTSVVAEGPYTLTAVAYDLVGNSTTSAPINVIVTDNAPMVQLLDLPEGTTIDAAVTLSASANDPVGVSMVEFLLDGALLGQVANAPYVLVLDPNMVASGPHTLTAKAHNADGGTASTSVLITTVVPIPGALQLAPRSGREPSGTLPLVATSERAVTWTALEYKEIGASTWQTEVVTGTFTNGSALISWRVPYLSGTYLVRVKLADGQGNWGYSQALQVAVPGAPASATITRDPATGDAVLRWELSPSPGTTYRIYKATVESLFSGKTSRLKVSPANLIVSGNQAEYRDRFVQRGTTTLYWYWVQVVDNSGIEGSLSVPLRLPPFL